MWHPPDAGARCEQSPGARTATQQPMNAVLTERVSVFLVIAPSSWFNCAATLTSSRPAKFNHLGSAAAKFGSFHHRA